MTKLTIYHGNMIAIGVNQCRVLRFLLNILDGTI